MTAQTLLKNDQVKEIISKRAYGYDAFNFDLTGMLEIERIDDMHVFADDDEATMAAVKDGVPIIPVDELPRNFDRRYFGWIDTMENRRMIAEYCREDA